jgi:hypothetical protein
MDILKSITSAFFEVEDKTNTETNKGVTLKPVEREPLVDTIPIRNITTKSTSEDVEKITEHFKDHFNSLNDPKPSYHEFKSMVDAMVQNGVDTNIAFRGSFLGLSAQGLKHEVLLETAEGSLNSIKTYIEDFNQSANEKYNGIISAKESEISALQSELEKITQRITEITKKIDENKSVISDTITKRDDKVRLFNEIGSEYIKTISNDIQVIKTINLTK